MLHSKAYEICVTQYKFFFPFLQIKFGTAKRLVKMQIVGQNKKKEIDE